MTSNEEKQACELTRQILCIWKNSFFESPLYKPVSPEQSPDLIGYTNHWNFHTKLHRQDGQTFEYLTTCCQPTKTHPVAPATASIHFMISTSLGQWKVSFRFEHQKFVYDLKIAKESSEADLTRQLRDYASLVGSPAKKINEIIASKIQNRLDPHIQALFPAPEDSNYAIKTIDVEYKPLPASRYTVEETAKLMNRSHLNPSLIAKVPAQ